MPTANPKAAPLRPEPPSTPVAAWTTLFLQPLLDAQRLQWNALLGWQQSIASLNKDVWEQWAVRYGGGVPIDG